MTRGRPWTRPEEVEAATLRWCGVPLKAIARRLGRPERSVQWKLCDVLGVMGPQRGKGELRAAVRRLARRGWFDWEIGLELGVNPSLVARTRKALGIPAADSRQSRRALSGWAKRRRA